MAFSRSIRWAADVNNYIKIRLGMVKAPSNLDVVLEDTMHIYQTITEEITNKTRNPSFNFTKYNSKEGQNLVQTNEWSSKSMHLISKPLDGAEILTETNIDLREKSALNMQRDMMSKSLDSMYKKLEEMEQTNAAQYQRKIENNKKTDKRFKEQEKATKELQMIAGRFEILEKKVDKKLPENYWDSTNKSCINMQQDMLAQSLESLHKKLEQMKQINVTQFENILQNNKAVEKRLKDFQEQEDATKFELQGMRRRLKSFEKTKHLKYYN